MPTFILKDYYSHDFEFLFLLGLHIDAFVQMELPQKASTK